LGDLSSGDLYVSPQGDDAWSGRLAEPNNEGTDGPVATICRARDIVRERKQSGRLTGAITVWVRGGRYALKEPITFGPEDSGPITYAAYPGEEVIFDGGVSLKGWQVTQRGGKTMWVIDLPAVREGKWYFRQLFVNGHRCPRPRLPKEGFFWMANVPGISVEAELFEGTDTFQCAPSDIRPWRNVTDIEVIVPHRWVDERMPIASFDEQTNTVKSSRRSIFALTDDRRKRYAKYWLENVFEGLSEPGEWYLDRTEGRLYYIPMPGEEMDAVEAYAPLTEQLLKLQGQPEKGQYVEFLRFEGLTFEHSGWYQPRGGGERHRRPAEVDYASAPQSALNIPGAVRMEGARYCAIEGCTLRHIGWYGIEVGDGCRAIRIVGNEMHDLGAGGVKIDGTDAAGPVLRRTGHNVVTDNHIYDGGHVFHSACGILATHTFGNELSHNHIHDFYYTGISCGWVWNYSDSVSKDNRIEKNHIHDLGKKLLSDLGGIYTLGVQPGTVIRGNLIHHVEKWNYGGRGIYPDASSSHMIIEDNIVYDTDSPAFRENWGRENIVRNNIFAFGGEGVIELGTSEGHNAFTFERNIVITEGKPVFAAGSSAARADIDRPTWRSDLNLFWDVSGQELFHASTRYDADAKLQYTRVLSMEEWQALGQDVHSMVADPCFRDLANRDFTLLENSPAFTLGFRPIDVSDVGPRPAARRE